MTRIVNLAGAPASSKTNLEASLEDTKKQLEIAQSEIGKPWEYEEELLSAQEKQSHINNALAFGEQRDEMVEEEEEAEI